MVTQEKTKPKPIFFYPSAENREFMETVKEQPDVRSMTHALDIIVSAIRERNLDKLKLISIDFPVN